MIVEYFSCEFLLLALSVILFLSLFYNLRLKNTLQEREVGDALLIKNAYFNELTQLPNRNNVEIMINEQIDRSKRHEKQFLVATIELLNYDKDKIVEFSNLILDSIRNEDILAHIEDNLFLIVFNEYLEEKNFVVLRRRFDSKIAKEKKFAIAIGKSKYPNDSETVSGLIDRAKKQIQ
jgi:GGDEF domain-containing protein